jgi:hypothetical protein
MTGGGFGGCTVTLLLKTCVTDLIKSIQVNDIFKENSEFNFIIKNFFRINIKGTHLSMFVAHVKERNQFQFNLLTFFQNKIKKATFSYLILIPFV